MTTMKNNDALLGIVLIAGAIWYSRGAQARGTGSLFKANAPLGTGSMPGSAGTGVSQALGGALGSFISGMFGGGSAKTATGAPILGGSEYAYLTSANYLNNQTVQEIAWDQASPDVIVPANLSTTGLEQDWTVG
ncbi:hypothetical protein ACO0LL_05640 [Undibacterium sp. TC4M20W]